MDEYGNEYMGIKAKSSKWEGTLSVEYPTTGDKAYTWTKATGHAVYFNIDGTAVGSGS